MSKSKLLQPTEQQLACDHYLVTAYRLKPRVKVWKCLKCFAVAREVENGRLFWRQPFRVIEGGRKP